MPAAASVRLRTRSVRAQNTVQSHPEQGLFRPRTGSIQDPLILRPFRSVDPGCSFSQAGGPPAGPQHGSTCGCPGTDLLGASEGGLHPGPEQAGPADLRAQNRRLLPDLKNPLHVIDGPEQRYFIGIIDIFTVYTFRKRLEHLWKTIRHPGRSFSTVSPQTYCLRLCDWIRDHTK